MKKLPYRVKISFYALVLIPMLFVFNARLSAQNSESLLWKISGNGLSQPSYLYGTIHLICKKDMIISNAFNRAFDRAEVVYIEMDPSAFKKVTARKRLNN